MDGVCDVKEDVTAVARQEEGFEEDLSSSSPVDLNRGTYLFLKIVLRYTETLLRRSQDSGNLFLLETLRTKANDMLHSMRHAASSFALERSYRCDISLVASDVFEAVQSDDSGDILKMTRVFIALVVNESPSSSYVSFMDLSDALITSNEQLKILEDEKKAEKADGDDPDPDLSAPNVISSLSDDFRESYATQHSRGGILKRPRKVGGRASGDDTFWRKVGLKSPPLGVTCAGTPNVYRVQTWLRPGVKVSELVVGLEEALLLYDCYILLTDLNHIPSIEAGNYSTLKALGKVADKNDYSQKFEKFVFGCVSSKSSSIITERDARIIMHLHKNRSAVDLTLNQSFIVEPHTC